MSERLYYADAYCREAMSGIHAKECRRGVWRLMLERTIFYPEGGGQPRDRGTIAGLEVQGLEVEGNDIVHLLPADPGPGMLKLKIDFASRFDFMQQHTAQHLLSQALDRLCGARTLSFAIGEGHSSIEIDRFDMDESELEATENECARIIFENRAVRIYETADVSRLPLRKPPRVSGLIRVVEIADYDWSACGGLHVRSAGELGLVKIVRSDRIRGHVRLYYVAGKRALSDYRLKHSVVSRLQRMVTQPPAEIPAAVDSLRREKEKVEKEWRTLRRREMDREIAAAAAESKDWLVRDLSGVEMSDLKFFALALMEKGKNVLAYAREPHPYLIIARGKGNTDLRKMAADIFAVLGGRGGGKEKIIEGRPADFSRLPDVLAMLENGDS